MKIVEYIFSITNSLEKRHKIITIIGLKFKIKRKPECYIEEILRKNNKALIKMMQRSITIALQHQKTFLSFKNKHQNQEIVLIGAGPTVNKFIPINNTVYVGCNRAFLLDKVKFDYLFSIDKVGIDQYYEEFLKYEGNNCIKFLGDQNLGKDFQIPESYILKLNNVLRYKTSIGFGLSHFSLDIDSEPLLNCASVALQAMQFILYTNPKRVYIVGIDCTVASQKHFTGQSYQNDKRNEDAQALDAKNKRYWASIKEFAQTYYPETEIISINPVGLKGLFRDIYTNENGEYMDEKGEKVCLK